MSHWKYKGKSVDSVDQLPKNSFGFVYLITNTIDDRKYIGRKQFGSRTRKPLTKAQKAAGRKRRTVVFKESNWKTYTSSSKEVNSDIKKLGKDKFEFEILICAESKGQCNYLEENIQHKLNALTDETYYNDSIGSRKFINIKMSPEFVNEINGMKL